MHQCINSRGIPVAAEFYRVVDVCRLRSSRPSGQANSSPFFAYSYLFDAIRLWDEPFAEALLRVLQLLDDPPALKVLGDARMKELAFAILRGDAGYSIRRALGGSYELSRAVNYLKDNLHENIAIDDLAKRAGMSRAVFHRKFKEATTYSPIQFIKALRLNNAAMLIAGGSTAGEAAYQVGYTSQSQFSREFRRHFGRTPRQWGGSMGPAREKLVAAAGS